MHSHTHTHTPITYTYIGKVVISLADFDGNESVDLAALGDCKMVEECKVGDGELLYFRVSIYVCMYACVCVCMCVRGCACVDVCVIWLKMAKLVMENSYVLCVLCMMYVCVCMYLYICVCVFSELVSMYVCMYVYVCMHVCLCMYLSFCVCVCVDVCM